ncbi:stomatin-like [Glossina fuscipes]|uniref:Stomatin-like n=1 Tax=Glossina fuscipes TaxID=7396 RepID=A0A9C6E1I6_9MUSC|nr:stomatin-like [Glossina fuscipes]
MELETLPRPSQNALINNNRNYTKQRRLLNDMHNMQSYNAYKSIKPVRTTTESTPRSETILIALSYLVVLILFPVAVFCCITTVKEYERVVILRLGRLRKRGMFGPGVLFLLPCVDEYYKVDMRTKAFDVEPQEILTKDSVTISVDAVVYYSIRNPLDSVLQVADVTESTRLLAQTTLRNVIGTKNLMEMLTAKETLSKTIEKILDDATDAWGVKVERVEMTDLRLPTSMQRAMAAEAEALREAKAKIVAAEGELNASRALKQASDVMASNPITLQLRYLQTLSTVSSEKNSTIIFPFPIEVMPTSTISAKSKF